MKQALSSTQQQQHGTNDAKPTELCIYTHIIIKQWKMQMQMFNVKWKYKEIKIK